MADGERVDLQIGWGPLDFVSLHINFLTLAVTCGQRNGHHNSHLLSSLSWLSTSTFVNH